MVDIGDQGRFQRRRETAADTGHEWHQALPRNARLYLPTSEPSYYPEMAGWLRYLADELSKIGTSEMTVGASKIELSVATRFIAKALREGKPAPRPYRETRTMVEIGTSLER